MRSAPRAVATSSPAAGTHREARLQRTATDAGQQVLRAIEEAARPTRSTAARQLPDGVLEAARERVRQRGEARRHPGQHPVDLRQRSR